MKGRWAIAIIAVVVPVATRAMSADEARNILKADASLMGEDRVGVPFLFKKAAPQALSVVAPLQGNEGGKWIRLGDATFVVPLMVDLVPSGGRIFGVSPDSDPPPRGGNKDGICSRSDAGRRFVAANRLEFAIAAGETIRKSSADAYRIRWRDRWLTATIKDFVASPDFAVLVLEFDDGEDQCSEGSESPPTPATPVRLTADNAGNCFVLIRSPSRSRVGTKGLKVASCRSYGAPTDTEIGPGLSASDKGSTVWIVSDGEPRLAGWLLGEPSALGWIHVTGIDVFDLLPRVASTISDRTATTPFVGVAVITPQPVGGSIAMTGARVTQLIPNGPASSAGLVVEDIITAIDGQPVTDVTDFLWFIRHASIGQTVAITVQRNSALVTLPVTLAAFPGDGS